MTDGLIQPAHGIHPSGLTAVAAAPGSAQCKTTSGHRCPCPGRLAVSRPSGRAHSRQNLPAVGPAREPRVTSNTLEAAPPADAVSELLRQPPHRDSTRDDRCARARGAPRGRAGLICLCERYRLDRGERILIAWLSRQGLAVQPSEPLTGAALRHGPRSSRARRWAVVTAAARIMPGVCGVLMSSSSLRTTRTPLVRQSVATLGVFHGLDQYVAEEAGFRRQAPGLCYRPVAGRRRGPWDGDVPDPQIAD